MYINPKIYKVFSGVKLIFSVLGFIGSIFAIIRMNDITEYVLKILPEFKAVSTITMIIIIVAALVSLLIAYIEFSAMFTFGEMIEHKSSNSTIPMRQSPFTLSPAIYRNFGYAVFFVGFIASFFAGVIMIIKYSVDKGAFLAIPVIYIGVLILVNIWLYIWYFVRFRSISDLLRVAYGEDSKLLDSNLQEIRPTNLYSCCTVFVVFCVLSIISNIVMMFILFKPIEIFLGTGAAWLTILMWIVALIVQIIVYAIYGCYVDNIGLMIERCQYERKLVSYDLKNKKPRIVRNVLCGFINSIFTRKHKDS